MADETTLKLGCTVRWTSQAGGHVKVKEGQVVYLGPKMPSWWYYMRDLHPDCCTPKFFAEIRDTSSILGERFKLCEAMAPHGVIVQVERVGKTGNRLKPQLYGPRMSKLEVVLSE